MAKRISKGGEIERAFSAALREIRLEHGLSQERLALESGYHRTYVGLLERGKQNPTLKTILGLAKVLNVTGSEIVGKVEEKLKES